MWNSSSKKILPNMSKVIRIKAMIWDLEVENDLLSELNF